MFAGFNLGQLVSSNTALNLLKIGIDKEFKKLGVDFKVTNYDVVYYGHRDAIAFRIYDYPTPGKSQMFKYDNGAIIASYFKKVVLPQKKITDTVDFIIVSTEKKTMEIYTSKDGEKLPIKIFKI